MIDLKEKLQTISNQIHIKKSEHLERLQRNFEASPVSIPVREALDYVHKLSKGRFGHSVDYRYLAVDLPFIIDGEKDDHGVYFTSRPLIWYGKTGSPKACKAGQSLSGTSELPSRKAISKANNDAVETLVGYMVKYAFEKGVLPLPAPLIESQNSQRSTLKSGRKIAARALQTLSNSVAVEKMAAAEELAKFHQAVEINHALSGIRRNISELIELPQSNLGVITAYPNNNSIKFSIFRRSRGFEDNFVYLQLCETGEMTAENWLVKSPEKLPAAPSLANIEAGGVRPRKQNLRNSRRAIENATDYIISVAVASNEIPLPPPREISFEEARIEGMSYVAARLQQISNEKESDRLMREAINTNPSVQGVKNILKKINRQGNANLSFTHEYDANPCHAKESSIQPDYLIKIWSKPILIPLTTISFSPDGDIGCEDAVVSAGQPLHPINPAVRLTDIIRITDRAVEAIATKVIERGAEAGGIILPPPNITGDHKPCAAKLSSVISAGTSKPQGLMRKRVEIT